MSFRTARSWEIDRYPRQRGRKLVPRHKHAAATCVCCSASCQPNEMRTSLEAAEAAFKWQSAQVEILETFEKSLLHY